MNIAHTLGSAGEQLVIQQLEKERFTILAKNYRVRSGEVDVIARKKDLIVFVEVKTRKNPWISALYSVNTQKQQKIYRAAQSYVLANKITDVVLRFDVAIVTIIAKTTTIEYIENAFAPSL